MSAKSLQIMGRINAVSPELSGLQIYILWRGGVAKLWVNEVFDVSLVVGKQLLVQLPTIESKDKQLQGSL